MKRACVCEKCLLQRLPRWKKAEQSFDILSLRKSTYNLFTLNRFNSSSSPAFTIFKMDERVFFLSLKTIHTHTHTNSICGNFHRMPFSGNKFLQYQSNAWDIKIENWVVIFIVNRRGTAARCFWPKIEINRRWRKWTFFFFFQRNDRQTK